MKKILKNVKEMSDYTTEKVVRGQLSTPIGTLTLTASDSELLFVEFPSSEGGSRIKPVDNSELPEVLRQAKIQLMEYFQGKRKQFELKLRPEGTAFQRSVWKEMEKIPYGKTRSYKDIAEALGDARKARPVGGAANKNPLPLVIPCHRVVGTNGSLTGFGGGVDVKKYLLELESGQRGPKNDKEI